MMMVVGVVLVAFVMRMMLTPLIMLFEMLVLGCAISIVT